MKHSELTFQAIVEATPNAIILVNREGRIAYINSQTEKLFERTRTELVGQQVEMLIPARYAGHHSNFRESFFEHPETRAMGSGRDLFALKKDGSEFPVEIGLNPLVTMDGIMVLVSIIDITERKKAEERFRLVVESAPNAMILTNKQGKITLINTEAERLFGYERAGLVGQTLEKLIPERFLKNHPGLRKSFFKAPTVRAMGAGRELYGLRKDGSEFPVEIGLNPIETNEGLVVLASVIDITERKKHEAVLKDQLMLEMKNKELEQFNYIASHDLQEPLRTVSNYVQVLEEDFSEVVDGAAMGHLQTIKRATERMTSLVRSLLDFSRLGNNRRLTKIDSQQLVEQVVADLHGLIDEHKATVIFDGLPVINGYETELRQLFQNLLNNAIKFRKPDVTPDIRIGHHVGEEGTQFSVSDNGIGIHEKHFERIFHVFNRLHSEDQFEGLGIGLANCKKIVELHRGKIWVTSQPGRGSTFKFIIPNLQL